MPKAVGKRREPASARPQEQQAAVAQPARNCAACEFFEVGQPNYCVRYPNPIAKYAHQWCGEFSER